MIYKNVFKVVGICLMSLLLMQCGNTNKFMISKGKVGKLSSETTMLDLQDIFSNDSIVKNLSEGALGNNFFQDEDEYLIFEKGGKHLLTIIPKEQLDSTSTIKSIQVFDERFETKSGITLKSTFEDIHLNNVISKVESSLTSAILFIDDLNITITLDKEDLGLKAFSTQKINLEQIPGLASVKSLIVWFN